MKLQLFIISLFFLLLNCSSGKENMYAGTGKSSSKLTVRAEIVEKQFVNKAGKNTGISEYYVRQSQQDYFIKFCESKVTRKEIEEILSTIEDSIKILEITMEIREGEWDQCDENTVQSRIGRYVVIHKIE
ncbi:MAG: hypothetical protein R3277_00350 [Brumimicrobium sp.]|nr:hypothetical protein [Brumimicrobium sp.]